jgi:uncharacterized repeat protein (TIGR01451 family)
LTKSASPTTYSTAGQVITYTYVITNTGNVPIMYPLQINDSVLGGQVIPCTAIAPCGGTATYTRTYTITADDLNLTSITNTAVAFIQVKPCTFVVTQGSSATITFVPL